MRILYRKLTEEQKKRGVIFSSTLSPIADDDVHEITNMKVTRHEVLKTDDDASETIERLKDTKFFNGSQFKYHIVRS